MPDGFICSPFIHIKEMYSIAGGLALYCGPFQQPSCHSFHSCLDGLKRHVRAPTRMDYDNFYMNANIKNSNEYFVNHHLFSSYSHMPLIKSKKILQEAYYVTETKKYPTPSLRLWSKWNVFHHDMHKTAVYNFLNK